MGDRAELWWYSNYAGTPRRLAAGVYGLSNHLLDTPWPKVERGKTALRAEIAERGEVNSEALFSLLAERQLADASLLPDTGVGLERERMLSPLFIASPDYGTRSSTVLLVEHGGEVLFAERTFGPGRPGP